MTRTSLSLALALVLGCGGPKQPEPVTGPTMESKLDPGVVDQEPPPKPVDPEPVDPEVVRKQKVDDALARIPTIKEGLTKLRALAFTADVPAQYQSADDFRTFVTAKVKEMIPAEKSAAMGAAMFHIGLLATPVDLAQTFGDAVTSQAAAYYDPDQKKFFVVVVPDQTLALDTMTAHELTHALQDQHFGLDKYLEPKTPLDEDQATARNFVVEGEATVTMLAYVGSSMGGDLLGAQGLSMFKATLGQTAAMTIDDFKNTTKAQASGAVGIDPEIQKSIDAMDAIPPVVLVPMMDSYMKGAVAVLAVFQAGGWAEVAKLYSDPPQSTEQVLHPDTKLVPTRDLPKRVTLPRLAGYTEVYGNTMGELEWRIYFMLWKKAVAESAAAGWDGDRWSVVKAKDGTQVGLLATTWDSAAEATEFATEYQATVAARFPKQERQVWVKTRGANVFIVDGGTDAKLIDKLVKGTKIK